MEPITLGTLARVAYEAYGHATGFKNYRGEPMPLYGDLGSTIRDAWEAATCAILAELNDIDGQESADLIHEAWVLTRENP